jgi:hypothetical protein
MKMQAFGILPFFWGGGGVIKYRIFPWEKEKLPRKTRKT